MKKEIVLSGVGGQGVVSVGEVMGLAASLYEENLCRRPMVPKLAEPSRKRMSS